MMLTPIPKAQLPGLLAAFARALVPQPLAARIFGRVGATLALVEGEDFSLSTLPRHRAQALALAARFGIRESPDTALTWDGRSIKPGMEPSLIAHEIAHLQVATPERRGLADFGLGAGPESLEGGPADAQQKLFGIEREWEEAQASLLGILWEVELGQPAILAFLEQNWLEGGASDANRDHFTHVVASLVELKLLDPDGRPLPVCRGGPPKYAWTGRYYSSG